MCFSAGGLDFDDGRTAPSPEASGQSLVFSDMEHSSSSQAGPGGIRAWSRTQPKYVPIPLAFSLVSFFFSLCFSDTDHFKLLFSSCLCQSQHFLSWPAAGEARAWGAAQGAQCPQSPPDGGSEEKWFPPLYSTGCPPSPCAASVQGGFRASSGAAPPPDHRGEATLPLTTSPRGLPAGPRHFGHAVAAPVLTRLCYLRGRCRNQWARMGITVNATALLPYSEFFTWSPRAWGAWEGNVFSASPPGTAQGWDVKSSHKSPNL